MPHTIASYTHSDATSKGKGGCLVKIETETDFGANTDQVQEFANKVARMGYGHTSTFDDEREAIADGVFNIDWDEMIEEYYFLEDEWLGLKANMKEEIKVTAIICLC